MPPPRERDVVVCPGGPLLVRDGVRIVDEGGEEILRRHRTVALCRCGRSGIFPWCDGTHKVILFEDRAGWEREDGCVSRRRAGG